MCMFSYKNSSAFTALAKGIERFECGSCPECLQKKSRKWALRASMEAKVSPGVMVTLTYDTYKVVDGKITSEENPVDTTLSVNKKHCQDFIKRLRKHFRDRRIKYLLTAEYGKRTGRAHYHALLFNVVFDDLIKYKKSKRNNIIYKSKTLEKIWKHGICTVDCINLSAKTARYCTKYCAKDAGADDTFMLFSRGIGDEKLMELFNGKNYWIDGREYPVPREIWQKYIEKKYNIPGYSRYKGRYHLEDCEKKLENNVKRLENLKCDVFDLPSSYHTTWKRELARLEGSPLAYERQRVKREIYQAYRDNDILYKKYVSYWKQKSAVYDFNRPSEYDRIHMLPDLKYWSYKQKAIQAKLKQVQKRDFVPPRSTIAAFFKVKMPKKAHAEKSFAPLSRHYTANDTIRSLYSVEWKELNRLRLAFTLSNPEGDVVSPF